MGKLISPFKHCPLSISQKWSTLFTHPLEQVAPDSTCKMSTFNFLLKSLCFSKQFCFSRNCHTFGGRQWHPTPVLLPGKSHGRRSLVGCSPWGPKSRTRLSDFTFTFHFHALEKEMATHSSILAWRIPGTGAWWAAVYGVTQSRTQLTWLSSSSSC